MNGDVACHPVRLAAGPVEVVVLPEYGARIHALRIEGRDLLRTPPDEREHARDPFFWGAYHMAPWCNRLAAGPLMVGGRLVDLAPNFPDGSAIHGQVHSAAFEQTGAGSFSVRAGGDGWPWRYEVSVAIEVKPDGFVVDQYVVNLDDAQMPAGIGLHPWFVKPLALAIRAGLVYASNDDSPAEPRPVAGADDLRLLGMMANGLDATWTRLADPPIEIEWRALGLRASLASSATDLHVTAASPGELDAVAIEPQTHAPQGLRRLLNGEPGALAWIDPGNELGQRVELRFRGGLPAINGG